MAKNIYLASGALQHKVANGKANRPYPAATKRKSGLKIPEDKLGDVAKIFVTAQNELSNTHFDVNQCTRPILNIAAEEIGKLNYDVYASTRNMLQIVRESGIHKGIEKILEKIF